MQKKGEINRCYIGDPQHLSLKHLRWRCIDSRLPQETKLSKQICFIPSIMSHTKESWNCGNNLKKTALWMNMSEEFAPTREHANNLISRRWKSNGRNRSENKEDKGLGSSERLCYGWRLLFFNGFYVLMLCFFPTFLPTPPL